MPQALAVLWEMLRDPEMDPQAKLTTVETMDRVFALDLLEDEKMELTGEIEQLVQQREQARKEKDFATSDRIRDQLKERGVILEDTKDGVRWRKS